MLRATGPRHSGRSDMSARNEDKNPSPVENQFYDFKDKQPKIIGVRHIFSVQLYVGSL